MATCPECGSEVPQDARFCSHCGAPISPKEEAPAQVEFSHGQDRPPPPYFGLPTGDFRPPPPKFEPPPPAFIDGAPKRASRTNQDRSAAPGNQKWPVARVLISCLSLVVCSLVFGLGYPLLTRVVVPWFEDQVAIFMPGETASPAEEPATEPLPTGVYTLLPAELPPSAVSATQPQMIPPTVPSQQATEASLGISYQGFGFFYDTVLAREVGRTTMPADLGPSLASAPEHILFTLEGYPIFNQIFRPEIRVYPVDGYRMANETAAETIVALQSLLQQKPGQIQSNLPFLPVMNAGQLIHARAAYLYFQNGTGLRYLTQFGQNTYPINNQDLIYTYQGLTNDSAYYVSAVLPIAHPDLPADGSQIPGGDYLAFDQQFQEYVGELAQMLNGSTADDFSPNMDLLDALIGSFVVNPQ